MRWVQLYLSLVFVFYLWWFNVEKVIRFLYPFVAKSMSRMDISVPNRSTIHPFLSDQRSPWNGTHSFFYREQNHCFIFLLPLQSVDNWKSAFVCHSDDMINIHMNSIESNLWRCSRCSRSNKVLIQGTKYIPKIGNLIRTTQIVA